jgi:putative dimethyl sulfoxide reductase chaperone
MSCIKLSSTHAVARSNLYKLFSLGFRYPDPDTFKTFRSGEFLAKIWDNASLLPHLDALTANRAEIEGKFRIEMAAFADFEVQFVETFDAPFAPCPLYEGFYREPRTAIMLEVSEFYRHFGLAMSRKEGNRELPDNLSAEFEFLHFLTFKEAQARLDKDQELLKGYILAQKDFLKRHLVLWVPEFCNSVQNSASMQFHVQLARITSTFIACELELHRDHPPRTYPSTTAPHQPLA